MAVSAKILNDKLRERYLSVIGEALGDKGEEVLRVGSNEFALPCLDEAGNEKFIVVTVKVPTVKLLFFLLPFHIVFFGRKSHSAQLKSGSCAPPPSGHSSYTHDLEFFCLGDFFFTLYLGL